MKTWICKDCKSEHLPTAAATDMYDFCNVCQEVTEHRKRNARVKVHAILVHKAAQLINTVGAKQDMTDVVFDYEEQSIQLFDCDGKFLTERNF